MAEQSDEKEQILERLPEWFKILKELYVRNFGDKNKRPQVNAWAIQNI